MKTLTVCVSTCPANVLDVYIHMCCFAVIFICSRSSSTAVLWTLRGQEPEHVQNKSPLIHTDKCEVYNKYTFNIYFKFVEPCLKQHWIVVM